MKRNLKLIILAFIVVVAILIYLNQLTSFNFEKSETNNIQKGVKQIYKFGLIPGLGGFGDKSFNDMQYNGVIKAKKKYNIDFEVKEPRKLSDFNQNLKELIEDDSCNVIFLGSYEWQPYIDSVSFKYSNVLFILMDCPAEKYNSNVASVLFKQNEGSYLAGALAGLMTRTNSIGAICGDKFNILDDFIIGYQAGLNKTNPEAKLTVKYISKEFKEKNPWESPEEAKMIAEELIKKEKCDIIFGIAAASNMGIFTACQKNDCYALGVDSDQDYLVQGTIVTSMMKNLDRAILFMAEKIIKDEFENKNYSLGLKENGVGLSEMKYTKQKVPADYLKKIEELKQEIISGNLQVPSVFN